MPRKYFYFPSLVIFYKVCVITLWTSEVIISTKKKKNKKNKKRMANMYKHVPCPSISICTSGIKYTLENTEEAIKNWQSRETGNIGYTRQRNTANAWETTIRKQ